MSRWLEREKIDVDKKVVIVTDKFRTVDKMLMPENLQDFLNQGKFIRERFYSSKVEFYLQEKSLLATVMMRKYMQCLRKMEQRLMRRNIFIFYLLIHGLSFCL